MMKQLILILIGLLVFGSNVKAQNTSFYIIIEDHDYIPKITGIEKETGKLLLSTNIAELQAIIDKYTIIDFKQAFPTAYSKFLQRTYLFECDDPGLGEELILKFSSKMSHLSYLEDIKLMYVPNDYGLVISQGNLDLIRAKEAFDLHMNLSKNPIAIVDNYFDTSHEDLWFSGILGPNTPIYTPPQNFHGTAVAGAAAAVSDNGVGLASVAYRTPIYGCTNTSDNDILLLAQAGYRVINCSWGRSYNYYPIPDSLFWEIRNTWNAVVICSAGNGGQYPTRQEYPASYSSNVSVTSVGHSSTNTDLHEQIPGDPSLY